MTDKRLVAFVAESNLIEGIERAPTVAEVEAAERFLRLVQVSVNGLADLQMIFAPGKPLRTLAGMDVYVGSYSAPPGGSNILRRLRALLRAVNEVADPWKTHVAFELLHPYSDGNGRTGRMLWAWQMRWLGRDPFALPFLHRFYYQTLEHSDGRKALSIALKRKAS